MNKSWYSHCWWVRTAWGHSGNGGSDAPTDSGYTKIYSTDSAFAALKPDGSITVWGNLTVIEPSDLRAARAELVEEILI
jgi:hypothetical protein